MSNAQDLHTRLSAGHEPSDWEAEYAAQPVTLTPDEVTALVRSDVPYAGWFSYRFHAGPPGVPLPSLEEALTAISGGADPTPRDAYRVVFSPEPLPDNLSEEIILAILSNCVAAASREGATWLTARLATYAGLAALALGFPERAWLMLAGITFKGQRHPQLEQLAAFGPLQGHPELEHSWWVRATICRLWPELGASGIPRLPWPSESSAEESVEATLNALERVGAHTARVLVEAFAQALAQAQAEQARLDAQDAHPLVQQLRRCAMDAEAALPQVVELPPWFEDWAKAVMKSGDFRLARLAGLLLYQTGASSPSLKALLVLPAAQRADLPLLLEGFKEPELRVILEELASTTSQLPPAAADALLAQCLPHHIEQVYALPTLARHIDALEALELRPGGVVEHARNLLRHLIADRKRDHDEAQPIYTKLMDDVSQAARQLGDLETLTESGIARAVDTLPLPPLTQGLLELVVESASGSPLEALLRALALHKAVVQTEYDAHWATIFAKQASDEISTLLPPLLFELRLRLLSELIESMPSGLSRAELYFQRANTRRALTSGELHSTSDVLTDLCCAMNFARKEGDRGILASATAMYARALAWHSTVGDSGLVGMLENADCAITDALVLPLKPFHQALLYQARAHLLRISNPKEAAEVLQQALALLSPQDRLWCELAAELVTAYTRAHCGALAVKHGLELLERTECQTERLDLGLLHLALGEALLMESRHEEARHHLEAGLALLRGRDHFNEANAHLHLMRLGLTTGNPELVGEHQRFLQDRGTALSLNAQIDLCRMEAELAAHAGNFRAYHQAWERALALAPNGVGRTRLLLERACMELELGHEVEDLNELIVQATTLPADQIITQLVTTLVRQHNAPLSEPARHALLAWSAWSSEPSALAQVHCLAGDTESACTILRAALSDELDAEERLTCTYMLVTLLAPEEREERQQLCEALECLLDGPVTNPHARLDLAAALHMDAGEDPTALQRAYWHAQRGLDDVHDSPAVQHAHRVMGCCVRDLVRISLPTSSPSQAAWAARLSDDSVPPIQELTELRLSTAEWLLVPGPLTHPEALREARRLLEFGLRSIPNIQQMRVLVERLKWVERWMTGPLPSTETPSSLNGPCDDLPSWMIDLVHGRSSCVSPEDIGASVQALVAALQTRPDAADHVLSTLIVSQHLIREPARSCFLDVVYSNVQGICESSEMAWPELRRALETISPEDHHPTLPLITSATRRSAPHLHRVWSDTPTPQSNFERGVALLQSLHEQPESPNATEQISEARQRLADAAQAAQSQGLPELFDYLVSYGNSWKTPPSQDLEKALEIYEIATQLGGVPEQEAKLWKVMADALLVRGAPDDVRQASTLLARSLEIRRGWMRVETLCSAAQAAIRHPDLGAFERVSRAVQYLMDAVRTDKAAAEQLLHLLLHHLEEWQRLRPEDPQPAQLRSELQDIYPDRSVGMEPLPRRLPEQEHAALSSLITHPAGWAFLQIRSRLCTETELQTEPYRLLDRLDPAERARVEQHIAAHTLVGRPDEIASLLDTLDPTPDDLARPGVLTARALLLAHLIRMKRRDADGMRAATDDALDALHEVQDPMVRAALYRELALIWSPDNHTDDPIRDFNLSASLLRTCVELEGGEAHALLGTLGAWARALRYTASTPERNNLFEVRRLYNVCLDRARASGVPDQIATILFNLAEVESQLGEGSRLERLRHSNDRMRDAAATASSPQLRARFTVHLAWQQTQLGSLLDGDERRTCLQEALNTFNHVDFDLLEDHTRRYAEDNRVGCEATLARLISGRPAEIEVWRRHLKSLARDEAPYRVAIVRHNLANALLLGRDVTREQLAEGLRLSEQVICVRTLEVDARHHWETAMNAGWALLQALEFAQPERLPMPTGEAVRLTHGWLRMALAAAHRLGPGEELATAALTLCRFAAGLNPIALAWEETERAWKAVNEAAAYLLLDRKSREQEAQVALHVGVMLAQREAEQTLAVDAQGLSFVLQGDRAERVGRWLLRSQQATLRPLRARLARPAGLSARRWEEWQATLQRRAPLEIAHTLTCIRDTNPHFLVEDRTDEALWRWLQTHPDSFAFALFLTRPLPLALVMEASTAGQRTWILGLDPPAHPPEVTALLSSSTTPGNPAQLSSDTRSVVVTDWIRLHLVEPIQRFMKRRPSVVLWCPDPSLRTIPPSAIWGDVPVALATSLALPDLRMAPGRSRSTLLVLADPGPSQPELDLRGHGVPALEQLARAARVHGSIRTMGSVGERFGRTLLGESSHVRDTPVSARDVLVEAQQHEVIVLIAHGQAKNPEAAALLCVTSQGHVERLDVAALSQTTRAFTGAGVVLLSCESGRTGASRVEPGGIAGTLISAGARYVIAPLWEIQLDVATAVGEAILRGLALGQSPWDVLARMKPGTLGGTPSLGRPARSRDEDRRRWEAQWSAFVTWVG